MARFFIAAAVVLALVGLVVAVVVREPLGEREWPWYVQVSVAPGPPEGAATVHEVDASLLERHGLVWDLTQRVIQGEAGHASTQTDEARARSVVEAFAADVGEDDLRFLTVRFVFEGRYYELSAGQPQP